MSALPRELARGAPPAWASGWGQDAYGVFAEFTVEKIVTRMRYIPPGTFRMGSPPDEKSRYGNEGPQHLVTITRGYWLGEAPCTQALWSAAMGENPSRFQTPERPVENVEPKQIEAFLRALDPALALRLPTEAEWEYACRAGTETPTYADELLVEGRQATLEDIAWTWESGDAVDLGKPGTRPVKQKRPNTWGLYDTIGNVWELCADGRRDYGPDPESDPEGPEAGRRVWRGGSWIDDAQDARAAYRNDHPIADGYSGFRLARGL